MEKLKLKLKAENRNTEKKASGLRRQGLIPAVIYNKGKTSHIQVLAKEVSRLFARGVSESVLIDLDIEGKNETVVIKDYAKHPVTENVLHLDFYRITFGEKINAKISIQIVGKAAGVREGGVMEQFLHEVEVEIFPNDLVSAIEVDVTDMKIGDLLYVSDLKLPADSRVLSGGDTAICQITRATKDETEAEAEPAVAVAVAEAESK